MTKSLNLLAVSRLKFVIMAHEVTLNYVLKSAYTVYSAVTQWKENPRRPIIRRVTYLRRLSIRKSHSALTTHSQSGGSSMDADC